MARFGPKKWRHNDEADDCPDAFINRIIDAEGETPSTKSTSSSRRQTRSPRRDRSRSPNRRHKSGVSTRRNTSDTHIKGGSKSTSRTPDFGDWNNLGDSCSSFGTRSLEATKTPEATALKNGPNRPKNSRKNRGSRMAAPWSENGFGKPRLLGHPNNWTDRDNCGFRYDFDMAPENIPGPSSQQAPEFSPLLEYNNRLKDDLSVADGVIKDKDTEIKALRSKVSALEASERHLKIENEKLRGEALDKEVTIRLAKRRFENMTHVKAQVPWMNACGAILNNMKAITSISEAMVADLGCGLSRKAEFQSVINRTEDGYIQLKNGRKVKVDHLNEWASDIRRGDRIVKYDWDEEFAWFKIKSQGDKDEDFSPLKVQVRDFKSK